MYTEITKCRICGNENLITVLSLGKQALTGVFPKSKNEKVSEGPLDLVWCSDCGLLQMKQSYELSEMYGDNYGYRTGLNGSMVKHISDKVKILERKAKPVAGDIVLDIGSNDGTLLNAYRKDLHRVGIDPTIKKFRKYYDEEITTIADFFTSEKYLSTYGDGAKIVTSIAMFYDLEHPAQFVKDVHDVLAPDGIWHFEQAYMPSMLRSTAYDAVCHEHLEFYSFTVINNLLQRCGMKVIDVEMNGTNGGSFAVTACRESCNKYRTNYPLIDWTLRQEKEMGLNTPRPYRDFEERVYRHRRNLQDLVRSLNNNGNTVIGYGASTKGNVLLQFCGFTWTDIPCIVEVNEDKFGSFTPGTGIPILSEDVVLGKTSPDYLIVFPWHFRENVIGRLQDYLANGGKLIFPLPEIEIV